MAAKKKRDLNELAASIVAQATDPTDEMLELIEKAKREGKDPAAVLLGQRGGKVGGKARAERLTAEQRSDIARVAATARWKKKNG